LRIEDVAQHVRDHSISSARQRQNQHRGSCSRIACIGSCVGLDKKLCNFVRLLAAAFLECPQSALALQCFLQLEQSRNVSKYGPAPHATRAHHSAAFPCHCDAGFDPGCVKTLGLV